MTSPNRLGRSAASAMRAAIAMARGNEVCFVCSLDAEGVVETARVVARGNVESVLALPGFARRGEMLVHNHPSGLLDPSDADYSVAARVHDDGIGCGIIDNTAQALYVVVEIPHARRQTALDPVNIEGDLGPGGAIAGLHTRYEDRASQRAMASTIARIYNTGGVGLLEAGTGVGKSLGYLVPALRWAAANGERTVVSTNTINLQEQLVGKDLPFLARALSDQKVRFALLKGWRNYLCLSRLDQASDGAAHLFDDGQAGELASLAQWAARTSDGSLADLPTPPRAEVWDEVSAEPDVCTRVKCTYFDKCFVYRARRAAAEADVIVVNHHLLLPDLAVRRAAQTWKDAAVLPAYGRLVIDEGHHLEDAAASHLGCTVTRRGLQRLDSRLDRRGKGLLPALAARLAAKRDLLSSASLDLVETRLAPAVAELREKSGLLCDLLETWLSTQGGTVVRLTHAFASDAIWQQGLSVALHGTLTASAGDVAARSRRFDFLASRLGLDDASLTPTTAVFPSPFDFSTQARLVVPTDIPAPNVDADGHRRAVTQIVLDVADASNGGLFVLFTSHREVKQLAAELRSRGVDRRWPLLVHGEESRDVLLDRFREAGQAAGRGNRAVLGGVGVSGAALPGVVVAHIPFPV